MSLDSKRLLGSFKLSARLAAAGICGIFMQCLYELWQKIAMDSELAGERLLVTYKVRVGETHGPLILVTNSAFGALKELVRNTPFFFLFYSFLSNVCLLYMGKKNFPFRAVAFATMLSYGLFFLGFFTGGILQQLTLLISWSLSTVAIRCSLPSDSLIFRGLLYQIAISVIGLTLIQLAKMFPLDKEWFVLFLYGALYPFLRDIMRFLGTRNAWHFSSKANIGGADMDTLHRQYAWIFVAWVQILWASYYRFLVVNLEDSLTAYAITFWQAVLELLMRLTVVKRDEALKGLTTKLRGIAGRKSKPKPRSTKVIVPLSSTTQSLAQTKEDAKRKFYSVVLVIEMLAEYTGIATSCFMVAFWKNHPISRSFQYYAKATLVGSTADLAPLFSRSALQLICELFVDAFCMYFEKQRDHWGSWKSITKSPKTFAMVYSYIATVGVTLGATIVFESDDSFSCANKDLCYCVNNGLVIEGAQESYCKFMYPNATWDANPTPILGPHISTLT